MPASPSLPGLGATLPFGFIDPAALPGVVPVSPKLPSEALPLPLPSLYFLEAAPVGGAPWLPAVAQPPPPVLPQIAQPPTPTPSGGSTLPAGFVEPTQLTAPPLASPAPVAGLPSSIGPSFYFLEAANAAPGVQPSAPSSAKPPASPGATLRPYDYSPDLVPDLGLPTKQFDVLSIRHDFPILSEIVDGRPLVWLDNAATTQKPSRVIERLSYFYEHENSNIHRAAHTLAARATDAYEAARDQVRRFLNAGSRREIVFQRGATEAINLIAQSWGRRYVEPGDEILITWLEHHSNIVPWQMLAKEKGARLRVAPVDDDGQILLDDYERLIGPRTRIVAFTHVSNALGTITPVEEMVAIAHRHGACVLVDGAQAVSHMPVDVQALDADFYVFSGHKVFAPTGIGVLYGKADLLDTMPPWQGGGNMISDVTFEKTTYQTAPARFEAGTGSIADAVGLGAALDYIEQLGMENIARYEHELLEYATAQLRRVPGLRLIGTAREKASVLSFVLNGFRSEDVGAALARQGIAVRAGHHCAQPCLRRYGLESSVRPSLALYNNVEDVDALVRALLRLQSERPSSFNGRYPQQAT
jgi:cysteine desulfurase/selenocysteine lyase